MSLLVAQLVSFSRVVCLTDPLRELKRWRSGRYSGVNSVGQFEEHRVYFLNIVE